MKRMIANIKDSPTGVKVPGDLIVDGNQTVVGYQTTGNYYEQDISATADMTAAGITMTFGQLRVKDGYLDIVLAMSRTITGSVQTGFSGFINLTVPEDVGSKILAASATDNFVSAAPFVGNDYVPHWSKLIKYSNTSIAIYLGEILPEASGATQLNGRIVFNILV